MKTFNEIIPVKLNMNWVIGDSFSFLDESITIFSSESCGEIFDLSAYNGELIIKYRPTESPLQIISTLSGDMIFNENVITFNNVNLDLKKGEYYYSLKLIDISNINKVGTLLNGKFKVIN